MSQNTMFVPLSTRHKHEPKGENIMEKYDATYRFGNTTVHVVSPDISDEEKERRINEMYAVAWHILWSLEQKGGDLVDETTGSNIQVCSRWNQK